MEKMWSFKTKNFTVVWEIEDDILDTMYMDKDMAAKCRKHVNSGNWRCFTSTISVRDNATGITLGEDFLGGSIYKKPAEFRDHFGMNAKGHGSYFSDMVREAIAQARKNFPAHQATLHKKAQALESVLSVRLRSTKADQVTA